MDTGALMPPKEDRRGYQDFMALVQSVKNDLREDMKDLKDYIDQKERNILTRINESHRDRQRWEEEHAGPLPTSTHGQLARTVAAHQVEHTTLTKEATKAQIISGAIILLGATSVTAFVTWAMNKLLSHP
jgi:thiamine pyrophosphate-dependent acetolactate synthase large subunit-like protein